MNFVLSVVHIKDRLVTFVK
ncbi:hypothetical protein D018_4410A, partial [Vibrio parahaemolyticus VP2007-007]